MALRSECRDPDCGVWPCGSMLVWGSHLRKWTPGESKLNSMKTPVEGFDLLRVVENERCSASMNCRET